MYLYRSLPWRRPGLAAHFRFDDHRFFEYVLQRDNSDVSYQYLTTYEDTFRANCPIGFQYESNQCRGKFRKRVDMSVYSMGELGVEVQD